jgi:Cyclic nucleotide-binding domain.
MDKMELVKIKGTVQVLKGGKEIRKMLKGDSFGEQALYYNTVRQATVRALDNVLFQ